MSNPEIIHTFNAGDPVPEWLFRLEPDSASSTRAAVTFISAGCVVLLGNHYHVVRKDMDEAAIYVSGGGDATGGAATKTVVIPLRAWVLECKGGGGVTCTLREDGRLYGPDGEIA